ncbi:inositol 1,4,5-trisphosphate receptor-interacting protein-like 2 [Cyprinus carpio]|uniref:Inositol 1,4,5-trisphosphate receptor-interacting protein-like 2 n=2 Tax=Cyprinus carpio TaxID=7962 RepID=A0A8C1L472_CYPCA|nr:inositol 1,4,5-trisphosphate receptor-interacting protein-like 2 [Cyprinus carpio]
MRGILLPSAHAASARELHRVNFPLHNSFCSRGQKEHQLGLVFSTWASGSTWASHNFSHRAGVDWKRTRRRMSVYTLNLRLFWPLVTCILTALLLLHQYIFIGAEEQGNDCADQGPGAVTLFKYILAFILCYFFIKYCSTQPGTARRGFHKVPEVHGKSGVSKRELLDDHYERHVRLSPHVLGHSKAHVAKLVSELVRVGRTDVPPESSLAFRGDFIQIGSSYEEHKVGSPDCFDILVPLRAPRGLKLEAGICTDKPGGPPICTLNTPRRAEWTRRHKAFVDMFMHLHNTQSVYRMSPDSVQRWFYTATQRCLAAVRYPFEQRCSLSLSLSEEQQVLLRLTPRSDYVCCHISMGIRLIPAFPLGDGAFLVPSRQGQRGEDLWTVYFPRQEQRLLAWLKGRLPPNSCHLKCLQLLKEVRNLSGETLDQQSGAEWGGVLSSYALKTAWLRLLLSTPPESWEEGNLVDRLDDLLRSLRESLQSRALCHLLLGGVNGFLPDSVVLPKVIKETVPANLWAEFSDVTLDMVSARLAYSWNHLPRLIRLGRPQRSSLGRGVRCKYIDAE